MPRAAREVSGGEDAIWFIFLQRIEILAGSGYYILRDPERIRSGEGRHRLVDHVRWSSCLSHLLAKRPDSGFWKLGQEHQDSSAIRTMGSQSQPVSRRPTAPLRSSSQAPRSRAQEGSGAVQVLAPAGCAWSAASRVSWITITGGNTGSGNGTVRYSVSPNGCPAVSRSNLTVTGLIIIAEQTFVVNQELANPGSGGGGPPH
jgi:hypothetical protein